MFEQILNEIKKHSTIIIHRHKNPDGDAIGSQMGLKAILCENFPEKRIFAVGDGAGRYSFVANSTMDEIDDGVYSDALAIILDTSASALISDDRYKIAKTTARIDHHIFCEKIADFEVTDTSYESCCGLVTQFALESELALSPVSAKALYTGMVTDSGRFRYDSTSSNTHRLASELMKQDFDTTDIYSNLYADDYKFIRLRAMYVLKIQFTEYKVAYIYTDKSEADSYGFDTFTLSRSMVNTMGDIRGVDIWVNFTETDSGVLAELRSSKFNINPVAVKYSGGGHAKASGATLKDRDEAMRMLEDLNAYNK
ncbi:MAG: bifunctional oligoribonuclease/PAP phosphatase NrnA [Ruminococcaceae bacterium]|nr:bifunctional oligoribonuclease/PAP phosphatase NrnA [Oscillospiraceae bacterium]